MVGYTCTPPCNRLVVQGRRSSAEEKGRTTIRCSLVSVQKGREAPEVSRAFFFFFKEGGKNHTSPERPVFERSPPLVCQLLEIHHTSARVAAGITNGAASTSRGTHWLAQKKKNGKRLEVVSLEAWMSFSPETPASFLARLPEVFLARRPLHKGQEDS